MNQEILRSKKFRTACIAAVASLVTFIAAKFGLAMESDQVNTLVMAVSSPFWVYIGAEGLSEMNAKKAIEENKARVELNETVLKQIMGVNNEDTK